jgi:hypothetical protein
MNMSIGCLILGLFIMFIFNFDKSFILCQKVIYLD